jgi:hypothetical protein
LNDTDPVPVSSWHRRRHGETVGGEVVEEVQLEDQLGPVADPPGVTADPECVAGICGDDGQGVIPSGLECSYANRWADVVVLADQIDHTAFQPVAVAHDASVLPGRSG